MLTSDDFSFEEDGHVYRNHEGIVRPSVTQCLALGGVFNYSMVDPAILEHKRIVGTNVHNWTADYDVGLNPDPMALTEEESGYARGWLRFVADTKPQWVEIEKGMLKRVHGIEIGGRPDRIAIIGRRMWVLDIKCTSVEHPGWRLQTALYEMMYTGLFYLGTMGRMAVRLRPDGTYVPNSKPYSDPSDANAAIAFLQCATWLQNNHIHRA